MFSFRPEAKLGASFCLLLLLVPLGGSDPCDLPGEVRLVETQTLRSVDGNVGRLEVCLEGLWGTISLRTPEHFWSDKNTQVACRQMGFSGGLNSIPPIKFPLVEKSPENISIHLENVGCTGEERVLVNCSANELRSFKQEDHEKDVFIVCRPKRVDYSELHVAGAQIGDIRLFGRIESGQGGVEIFTDVLGWTGICPDRWGNTHARIVCQALGYDSGIARNLAVSDSSASVTLSVRDAICSDTSFTSSTSRVHAKFCSFQEIILPALCMEAEYAGVMCGASDTSMNDPIRMFGSGRFDSSRAVGVVEVFLDSRWGLVCESNPQELKADILCKRLFPSDEGENTPLQIPIASLRKYESGLKPIWVNGITCPAAAVGFINCTLEEPLGFSNCSSGHILALDCGSTAVRREGNTTAIIIGIGVTLFIFVLVFFVFGQVLFTTWRKKQRAQVPLAAVSLALSGDLGQPDPSSGGGAGGGASNGGAMGGACGDELKEGDEMSPADSTEKEKLSA